MLPWRRSLHEWLRGQEAPRVLDFAGISQAALAARGLGAGDGAHERAVRRFLREAESLGFLRQVRSGIWLNEAAFPAPAPAEAASRIRSGAVVSLQTVLGDAGVLNNYTTQVYAVIPRRKGGPNPATGTLQGAGTLFHFRSLPEEVLEAGDRWDRLVSTVAYPRATAEAALVHWFYLASSPQSDLRRPDTQCDVTLLDPERLEKLAGPAGVLDAVREWMEACRARQEMDDAHEGWAPGSI